MSGLALRLAPSSASWLEQAACRGRDTSWWFSKPGSWETAVALSICRRCPAREPCLADGLAVDAVGTWGGLTEEDRRRLHVHVA